MAFNFSESRLSHADPVAFFSSLLENVHNEYLKLYGARRAFYRYVQELLPQEQSRELFYSIRIRKTDPTQNTEVEVIEDDGKKLAFLYQTRNAYTHSAINTGSAAGGVFPNWGKPVMIDGVPKMGWEPIHYESRGEFRYEHSVRDWPNVLINTVRAGL